jgi:multiple sugar transport system substrate-binding protein
MIRIDFSMTWGDRRTWQRVVEEFNRQHRDQIRVRYRHFEGGEYYDELQEMFEGDQDDDDDDDNDNDDDNNGGRRIDVIGGDIPWTAGFADKGWLADLSGRFPQAERQQFLPATIQANTYQGKVWGVPWFTDVGLLFYRKDLLANPPQTWNELKQRALQVKQASGLPHGYVFQGAQSEGGVINGLEYIWTHGGDVLDPANPTQVIIGSPQTEAGLTTERSMIVDDVSPPDVASYDLFESWDEFISGRSVFWRGWPGFYTEFLGPRPPLRQDQVDVAPIPAGMGGQSAGCLGGFNLFINADSNADRQDAAWQFIQFMASANTQKERAVKDVLLPTRQALYQDPDVQQVPIIQSAKAALDNSRARPAHPRYTEMSAVMAEQFNFCLKGQVTPAQAAQTLQMRLSNLV